MAAEVAAALDLPLDILLVRKLGVPQQPELAMGAIGEQGVIVEEPDVMRSARITDRVWRQVIAQEQATLNHQASTFRSGGEPADLAGRIAVIVDDGIATGSTVRAACRIARRLGARSVIVAAPVAPIESVDELRSDADEVVTVATPRPFRAIGLFYKDFSQVPDREVVRLLAAAQEGA